MSEAKEDGSLNPFKLLRDFFDALYMRVADRSKEDPLFAQHVTSLTKEIEQTAASFAAEPKITFNPKPNGPWSLSSGDGWGAQMDYVPSDLYLRSGDGNVQEQKIAARARALGHVFISVGHVKYGLRQLGKSLPASIHNHPGFRTFWEKLLFTRMAGASVAKAKKSTLSAEGIKSGVSLILKDEYDIDNELIRDGLFQGLPLPARYWSSIFYRFYHYDPTSGNMSDPRVKDAHLEAVVQSSIGTFDQEEHYGWGKIIFYPKDINEPQILAIARRLWPVYQALYDEELKARERWEAFERKMAEEKKQATQKDFEDLTPEQIQELDDYIQQMPQEEREELIKEIQEEMDQQGQGQQSASGKSQSEKSAPGAKPSGSTGQGKASGNNASLPETLKGLQDKIDQLSKRVEGMAQGVQAVKDKVDNVQLENSDADISEQQKAADTIEGLAGEIQSNAGELLGEARSVAKAGQDQKNTVDWKKDLKSAKGLSGELEGTTDDLKAQLEHLMDQANALKRLVGELKQTVNEPSPAGERVSAQVRGIEQQAEEIKETADTTSGKIRDVKSLAHQLEAALNKIEQKIAGKRIEQSTSEAGESAQQGMPAPADQNRKDDLQMPNPLVVHLPGDPSLQDILSEETARNAPTIKPVVMRDFDPKAAQLAEDEDLMRTTGLTKIQYDKLQLLYKQELLIGSEQMSVRQLIDQMTDALSVLTLPQVDIQKMMNLKTGPLLSVVKVITGEDARGKWVPSEAVPMKITLVMDRSGSMGFDIDGEHLKPIEITRWIQFIFLNALFEHNRERARLVFHPIEFEIGYFDAEGKLMISHETSALQKIPEEKLLYDSYTSLKAEGGTEFSKYLHIFKDRLLEGDPEAVRVLFAVTDEDVGPDQKGEVLGTIQDGEEKGADIYIAPVVAKNKLPNIRTLHADHPEHLIEPYPFDELIVKFAQAIVRSVVPQGKAYNSEAFNAAMTATKVGPLNKISGYEHFFTQNVDGREYLVFKRGKEDVLYFQRGAGGPNVPLTIVPGDIDQNDDVMIRLLQILYRTGQTYTTVSPDGQYMIQPIHGEQVEILLSDGKDGWNKMHTFKPLQPWAETSEDSTRFIFKNKKGLKIKKEKTSEQISLSRQNGDFQSIAGLTDVGDLNFWSFYEHADNQILAFNDTTQEVLIIDLQQGQWKLSQRIALVPKDRSNSWDGKFAELIGETGVGKDELILAAAHLLNEEVYVLNAHSDIDVQELSTGFRAVGHQEAGTSGWEPSGYSKVMHNSGWYIIREAHKLRPGVFNALKSHITAQDHKYPKEQEGIERLKSVRNHPRARLITSVNFIRTGILGYDMENNAPMLDRQESIEVTWLPQDKEIELQTGYALDLAKQRGLHQDDWADFEQRIKNTITELVGVAKDLRLAFAGYSAQQQGAINRDWKLLDEKYRFLKMSEETVEGKEIKRLFEKGPAHRKGLLLKRPPSARVLRNIIRHYVVYDRDWRLRPRTITKRYYNFDAEVDTNTYGKLESELNAHNVWAHEAPQGALVLDGESFKVDGDYLRIIPKQALGQKGWDEVHIPLHPQASIRTRGVPKEIIEWLDESPDNAAKLYYYLQAFGAFGMHAIFVGDPGTGKSTMTDAIEKLLNFDMLKEEITEEMSAPELTFTQEVKAFHTRFFRQILPRAMNTNGIGQILNLDESSQGRMSMLALLNEVSERNQLVDPTSESQMLKGARGFGIIHTINKPGKSDKVRSFPDDFLERHLVLRFDPLPADQILKRIQIAGVGNNGDPINRVDVQINSHLVGELQDDGTYSGMVGVYQEIMNLIAAQPKRWPRNRDLSTRNMIAWAKAIVDRFDYEASKPNALAQNVLLKLFWDVMTLKGKAEDGNGKGLIMDAFRNKNLWQADPTKADALETFLNGESVLVENLKPFQIPDTGDKAVDRMLIFMQTNTANATGVNSQINRLNEYMRKMLDPNDWAMLTPQQKLERLNVIRETYHLLGATLEKLGGNALGPRHAVGNQEAMQHSKGLLRVQLVKLDFPKEVLDKTFELKANGLDDFKTDDPKMDEAIFKATVFAAVKDYYQQQLAYILGQMNEYQRDIPFLEKWLKIFTALDQQTFGTVTNHIEDLIQKEKARLSATRPDEQSYEQQLQHVREQIANIRKQLESVQTQQSVSELELLPQEQMVPETIDVNSPVNGVAISPDGTRIASGSLDNTIKIWPIAKQVLAGAPALPTSPSADELEQQLKALEEEEQELLQRLQASRASASAQNQIPIAPTLPVSQMSPPVVHAELLAPSEIMVEEKYDKFPGPVMAVSKDGHYVAVRVKRNIEIWDMGAKGGSQVFKKLLDNVNAINAAFSADGKIFVSSKNNQEINVWDLAKPAEQEFLKSFPTSYTSNGFSLSEDGRRLAVLDAGPATVVHIWDVESGNKLKTIRYSLVNGISVAFANPQGTLLMVANASGKVMVLDMDGRAQDQWQLPLRKGNPVYSQSRETISDLIIQGNILAAHQGNGIVVFEKPKGTQRAKVKLEIASRPNAPITALAISPDGTTVFAGNTDGSFKKAIVAKPSNARVPYDEPRPVPDNQGYGQLAALMRKDIKLAPGEEIKLVFPYTQQGQPRYVMASNFRTEEYGFENGTWESLPNNQRIFSDNNKMIKSVLPYKYKGEDRFLVLSQDGQVIFFNNINGQWMLKSMFQSDDQVANYMEKLNNEQIEFLSSYGHRSSKRYIIVTNNKVHEVGWDGLVWSQVFPEEENLAKAIRQVLAKNDTVKSLLTYTQDKEQHCLIVGEKGVVYEYAWRKGEWKDLQINEPGLAREILQSHHTNNSTKDVFKYTVANQDRYVSLGLGSVYEHVWQNGQWNSREINPKDQGFLQNTLARPGDIFRHMSFDDGLNEVHWLVGINVSVFEQTPQSSKAQISPATDPASIAPDKTGGIDLTALKSANTSNSAPRMSMDGYSLEQWSKIPGLTARITTIKPEILPNWVLNNN